MSSPTPIDSPFRSSLDAYRRQWPGEDRVVDLFEALLDEHDTQAGASAYARERLDGHFTASS